MATPGPIEPFGFFTWDALRAGWYVSWRLLARVVPIMAAPAIAIPFIVPTMGRLGGFVVAVGFVVAAGWAISLLPRLASQWARMYYGRPLTGALAVWWGIAWRSFVVSLVAAFVVSIPTVVGTSLSIAYGGGLLGVLGWLIVSLVQLANLVVTVLATGWAMSRVAAEQLSGFVPIAPMLTEPIARPAAEGESQPGAAAEPAPVAPPSPRPTIVAPAAPAAPAVVSAEGKRQCPKCGLYETERGSVIGVYCKVCGWREGRR